MSTHDEDTGFGRPTREGSEMDRREGRHGFIVAGVSGSSGSPMALRWALDTARRRNLRLVAVRAYKVPPPPGPCDPPPRGWPTATR